MHIQKKTLNPCLKWVGGKQQLLEELLALIPSFSCYYEPFLGAGALLLGLQPEQAIVGDINPELINLYEVIKQHLKTLISHLTNHAQKYANLGEDYYLEQRERRNKLTKEFSILTLNIELASLTLFLNSTCLDGLYQLNSNLEFISPHGNQLKFEYDESNLIALSHYFNHNQISFQNANYEISLQTVTDSDFVYLDPPYYKIYATSKLSSCYNDKWEVLAHQNLKEYMDHLSKRGVKVLQSNSDNPFIRKLYQDYHIKTIKTLPIFNIKGDKPKEITQLIISNYL